MSNPGIILCVQAITPKLACGIPPRPGHAGDRHVDKMPGDTTGCAPRCVTLKMDRPEDAQVDHAGIHDGIQSPSKTIPSNELRQADRREQAGSDSRGKRIAQLRRLRPLLQCAQSLPKKILGKIPKSTLDRLIRSDLMHLTA